MSILGDVDGAGEPAGEGRLKLAGLRVIEGVRRQAELRQGRPAVKRMLKARLGLEGVDEAASPVRCGDAAGGELPVQAQLSPASLPSSALAGGL